ncbi:PDR/VanB family oxidoreductase [Acinetobacter indicus]|uniref:PDR/VanB family oxidoreductase n=1 Tax=Acinetobacter indicus TaxID=756892 RepID=UPI0014443776|nr:PDR/VanB family oxidoreductase [Acinetobacter indicus]MDM1285738.1 oxidoreductase [Acinetobacter indicus]
MDVTIHQIQRHNPQILSFELIGCNGEPLPPFKAGAHIDVHMQDGLIRQYSLANCSSEQHRYVIGVLNDPHSRGGSRFMHEQLQVGQRIQISEPRNLFELDHELEHAILCAGGIGITPILAMAKELKRQHKPFKLFYFIKTRSVLAFQEDLTELGDAVHLHIDDERDTHCNLIQELQDFSPTQHIYVCGPNGFMDFVIQTAQQLSWPTHHLHKEHFAAPALESSTDGSFDLKILKTGQLIHVTQEQTAVQALEAAGFPVPVSCEQGICGTCLLNVVEGEIDHRDMYLTEEEQAAHDQFTPCCSRAKSKILVIDL